MYSVHASTYLYACIQICRCVHRIHNTPTRVYFIIISHVYPVCRGPGSVVGIATAYGLDGPGIGSRWG